MPAYEYLDNKIAMIASAKTYNKAIKEINEAWEECFGEQLILSGGVPTERFQQVISQLKMKLKNAQTRQILSESLDIAASDSAEGMLQEFIEAVEDTKIIKNVDDLTANQILSAFYTVAYDFAEENTAVDVEMTTFLKAAIRKISHEGPKPLKMNVGKNRHFPRLYQWLKEFEEGTDWGDIKGFHIKNASGKGRVRSRPTDPRTLKITIQLEYLG